MIRISYLPGASGYSNRVSGAGGVSDKSSDNGSSQQPTERDTLRRGDPSELR